ncbi:unnamed protein product [Rodentolepis nana]|uniref:CAP_C domain-containing protein n=1 Tax=Rodentolepis nana TaxID=102285 RepID=A0A0R3T4P2_RODNA|nr:unnamed protein product [Rodentolepis nana]
MDKLTKLVERLENIADHLETANIREKSLKLIEGDNNNSVVLQPSKIPTMNSALNAPLQKLVSLSADISPDVKKQCDLLVVAFKAVSDFVESASSMSKPSDSQLPGVLSPCSAAIQKVVEYKDANRSSADFNHLAAVAESVSALGWVAMSGKPCDYIEEMSEAGKFYSNRILKEFKDNNMLVCDIVFHPRCRDEKRVQWVHALTDLWKQLKAYTSANYPSGLVWGSAGSPSFAPPPSSGGAPPPPPPPCPEPSESSAQPSGPDTRALFAEINRADAASRGLRKVKKGAEHAAGGVVPSGAKKTAAPAIPARPDQRKAVDQSKVELIGNKWNVVSTLISATLLTHLCVDTMDLFKRWQK